MKNYSLVTMKIDLLRTAEIVAIATAIAIDANTHHSVLRWIKHYIETIK